MSKPPEFRPTEALRIPLDRRRFLLASTGSLVGAGLAACTSNDNSRGGASSSTNSSGNVASGATGGAKAGPIKPGSVGLMDEDVFQERVDAYLLFATASLSPGNATSVASHLLRAGRDPKFVWDPKAVTAEAMSKSFEKIDNWEDTRDFDLMYLTWLLYLGEGDTELTRLDPGLLGEIENRLAANRYRYDDPLPADRLDNQWFWSENHIIINLTNEYLAGQRMPDRKFTVTGLTGAEHMGRSKPEILNWVAERIDLGFFEWHSNVYMLKNITPLLMLAELSADDEVAAAAAIGMDLCLLDMASHNHAGCYTAPRGRTYKKDKMSSLDEATFDTAKFVFNDTDAGYTSATDGGATYLCAATRYRPPQALVEIATASGASVVRERHGVYFDGSTPVVDNPKAPYGKDFDDPANLSFWWSLGAIGMWPLAETGIAAGNKFRLWDTKLFSQVKLMAALNDYDPKRVAPWLQARAAAINFGFLSEANTYAYREDKVSLATVIDHRPGEMRDQAHSWQAAIDENALVFTNHPVTDAEHSTEWRDDGRPGYWTGEASMPRSAQFKRTAVHLYLPKWDEQTDPLVWGVFGYRPFTHAYVPQDHFDRMVQNGNWTIGERNGAYIALWSWRTPTWRVYDPAVIATRDMVKPFDLVAEGGPDNVWIVEVGTEEDGELDAFVAKLTANPPQVERGDDGFSVAWTSPSSGAIAFSNTGPFTVDGKEQKLSDFPRHESPWGSVDHLAKKYTLEAGEAKWAVDSKGWKRQVS